MAMMQTVMCEHIFRSPGGNNGAGFGSGYSGSYGGGAMKSSGGYSQRGSGPYGGRLSTILFVHDASVLRVYVH